MIAKHSSTQVLPSAQSAVDLFNGDKSAILSVGRDLLMRSSLIGVGLYLAGERDQLVKKSLFAGAAIEVAVLGFAWHHSRKT